MKVVLAFHLDSFEDYLTVGTGIPILNRQRVEACADGSVSNFVFVDGALTTKP